MFEEKCGNTSRKEHEFKSANCYEEREKERVSNSEERALLTDQHHGMESPMCPQ